MDQSKQISAGKLGVGLAVTGLVTLILTSWLLASLLSLAKLSNQDCPRTLGTRVPTSVTRRVEGRNVACIYEQLPSGERLLVPQSRPVIGIPTLMAIYFLNAAPIVVFSFLFPGKAPNSGAFPGRVRGFQGFFGARHPMLELVAGILMLIIAGQFWWVGLTIGFPKVTSWIVISVIFGGVSLVRGGKGLQLTEEDEID